MGSFGGLGFMLCLSISEELPKPKTGVAVSSFSFPVFFYKKKQNNSWTYGVHKARMITYL